MWDSNDEQTYGDRFIPERRLLGLYDLVGETSPKPPKATNVTQSTDLVKDEANKVFQAVLRSELFGVESNEIVRDENSFPNGTSISSSPQKNLFQYKSPTKTQNFGIDSPNKESYSLSPLTSESQNLLLSPRKAPRNIPKTPFKVLDAPQLKDDFYLNLLDWSSQNMLSVGLGKCVYLWSAGTCKVTKLCNLGPYDSVTSVNWAEKGSHLAVGTNRGFVQIWDIARQKKIRTIPAHEAARVGCLAWNSHLLASGSRDRTIKFHDLRAPSEVKELTGHRQEVCGLKWSPNGQQLASGGNDNKLFVWDRLQTTPVHRFTEHCAAVKAIAWSPHQNGLLASGGGTADKRIYFRNTITGTTQSWIDTGSQVCNLSWSSNVNELVSTHGYSQNQVVVWKCPSMEPIATLTGHTYRVLYLAMSPDGETIVTGAGDETLRFWNVFSKSNSPKEHDSVLDPFSQIR